MKHCEGTFAGFGGSPLFYQSWYPDNGVQAVVVMVHGLGAHSGAFEPAVPYLLAQGYATYAFDLRGHGRSPGQRGYINTWAEFRADLGAFLERVQNQHPGCPCFLWGHSLGGTIALDYALRSPTGLQGLILTAPALSKVGISPFKLAVGRLLSRVYPRFSLSAGIQHNLSSRDPKILAIYAQDALRHKYGSARLATEFFTTVDWLYEHATALQVPLLILHGSADRITLPESSHAFFQRVLFADREYREYDGSYHDLYADLDAQTVMMDFSRWLKQHLQGTESCQKLAGCVL